MKNDSTDEKMREDIQCLRGIAILLVLLFHLWPNLFVNGFLGVDMFFVISGFLMARTLTENELKNIGDFSKFYYKRFRRIFPMYFLVLFATVVMVHLYLADFLWNNNNIYSLASMFFVTNQLVIADQTDYFNEFLASSSSVNAFLHLWSLSLEIQFYLLVPFIFFGLQFIKHDYVKLVTVTFITIFGLISFVIVVPKFAFNFMFLRLWQFSAGFVALFWIKTTENLPKKERNPNYLRIFKSPITEEEAVIISISIMALCLLPNKISVNLMRPLVTLSTALIIALGSQNIKILQSKSLCYIGNISYVMYLIHWPIITIFLSSTLHSYIFCILTIAMSSVLLHHLFEKQYLKMDMKSVFFLVLAIFVGNAYLQYSVRIDNVWKNNLPVETRETIRKNMISAELQKKKAEENCIENDLEIPFGIREASLLNCRYPRGNGSLSIMVIGNSYGQHMGENLRAHFNNNYSEYRSIATIANFVSFAEDTEYSKNGLEVSKKLVELHKPDVLIIMSRFAENMKSQTKENDKLVQEINENIAFYEKFISKVYILGAHPLYTDNFLNSFLHRVVAKPDDIESLHLNKVQTDREMKFVKKRLEMVKCQKCHIFDLSHVFLEDDKYLTFDRDSLMSYVDNSLHITAEGMKLVEPIFKNIANEIMNNF